MKKKAALDSRKTDILISYNTKIVVGAIHVFYLILFYIFLGLGCGLGIGCSGLFVYGSLAAAAVVLSIPLISLYLMEKNIRFGFIILISLAIDLIWIVRSLVLGTQAIITPMVIFQYFILQPFLIGIPLMTPHICILLHTVNVYKNKQIKIQRIIKWAAVIWVIFGIIYFAQSA